MKRLLIASLFCLVFSSGAQGGHSGISSWSYEDLDVTLGAPTPDDPTAYCAYKCKPGQQFYAYVQGSKGMVFSLDLLVNDTVTSLYSVLFTSSHGLGVNVCPAFELPEGSSWSLTWTLSSTKGKGRILDAIEVASDSCGGQ